MAKTKQTGNEAGAAAVSNNGKCTPEELRRSLQEFGIDSSQSQAKAIGAIYRVATHEPEIDLRVLLSAVGRMQNLQSLCLRATALASKKTVNSQFFLSE
jgi:hypothetical protein